VDKASLISSGTDFSAPGATSHNGEVHTEALIDGYELWERPGYLLRRSHRLHGIVWARRAPVGLTSPQFGALSVLEREPGIDQQMLGQELSLDRASIAGIVRRLLRSGWLLRVRDDKDSRRNLLTLSADAAARMPAVRAAAEDVWNELFAPVPDAERDEFVSMLGRLVSHVAVVRDAGAIFRRLEQKRAATWSTVIGSVFTGPQWTVLHVIGRWPGLSQKDIAELAALDKSTVAEIVDRLVARGWVRREVDQVDGRVRRLTLTPQTFQVVRDLMPSLDEVQTRLLAPLSVEEIPGLMRNWTKLAYAGEPPVAM
jgi:DNA-binding MarR family transcriptional regulator